MLHSGTEKCETEFDFRKQVSNEKTTATLLKKYEDTPGYHKGFS